MLSQENVEEKLNNNEKKIRELAILLEKVDNDVSIFLQELEVTPEQLTTFISNQENFTENNWLELQKQKKQLDEKLDTALKNVRNPLKAKKALDALHVPRHWLHVR